EPAPVYATTRARIDPHLLFDVPQRGEPTVAEQLSFDELLAEHDHHDDDGHRHLHDDYDTVTFTSTAPLDPRGLVEFLEKPPPGLFRAKGPVVFGVEGEHRKFLLHMVGRHVVFEPLTARGESEQTCVVLIGAGLDAEATTKRLETTVHTDADPLDAQTLLGVWHYVPRDLSDALQYADL
ncbi:GTP-binding protein, partial [Nocardia gipuzkoensis]